MKITAQCIAMDTEYRVQHVCSICISYTWDVHAEIRVKSLKEHHFEIAFHIVRVFKYLQVDMRIQHFHNLHIKLCVCVCVCVFQAACITQQSSTLAVTHGTPTQLEDLTKDNGLL